MKRPYESPRIIESGKLDKWPEPHLVVRLADEGRRSDEKQHHTRTATPPRARKRPSPS